jgi:hypothetical protein
MTLRDLSAGYLTEAAKTVTLPGLLVEIEFASPTAPLRVSSRGDVTWDGKIFVEWGFRSDGLETDGAQATVSGQLVFDDPTLALTTLVLQNAIADRPIRVWPFYGAAPGLFDPLYLFEGVGDDAAIDPTTGRVTISIMQGGGSTLFAPRTYITRENGFNWITPRGTIIPWAGEVYILEGERG